MAHAIISLTDSILESVRVDSSDTAHVRFSPAIVVKSQGIAGVDPSTRWAQEGVVRFREAEVSGPAVTAPVPTTGGSLECGGLRYVDMVPLPLDEPPGLAELRLRLGDGELVVTGRDPRFDAEGHAQYLGPIPETQPAG